MGKNSADKLIGERRQAQPSWVFVIKEEVLIGDSVRQVVVDMASISDSAGERLGHVSGDGAYLMSELARHHLEERVAVSRCQCVRVCEVDFILAIAVFVVGLVRLPT